MEESLLKELATQVPALVVLVFVVVVFLRYLGKRDEQFSNTIREVANQCHTVQREANETARTCATASADIRPVLEDVRDTLLLLRK